MLFRRASSHDVSFGDRPEASRIDGLFGGQAPAVGVYPFGAFGKARISRSTSASAAETSRDESRGLTT